MFADLVRESSTTTGTGTFTTLGATSGFRTFLAAYATGNEMVYTARNLAVPTEWEVGIGVVTSGSCSSSHAEARYAGSHGIVPVEMEIVPLRSPIASDALLTRLMRICRICASPGSDLTRMR